MYLPVAVPSTSNTLTVIGNDAGSLSNSIGRVGLFLLAIGYPDLSNLTVRAIVNYTMKIRKVIMLI